MRISDWSSDVCSSDLADAIALHHAVRKPAMIEKRHPAFEQKALRGELQNLVVDGEIAAFERHVRAAEFGGFAQEFERDSADMLFAEMAEFADRSHQRACLHAASATLPPDQQKP